MSKPRATTRTCFEIEYPVMIESLEQSVHGPYTKVETFLSLPLAERRHDELMNSTEPHLASRTYAIELREVSTTILRQGGAHYERKLSPTPKKRPAPKRNA